MEDLTKIGTILIHSYGMAIVLFFLFDNLRERRSVPLTRKPGIARIKNSCGTPLKITARGESSSRGFGQLSHRSPGILLLFSLCFIPKGLEGTPFSFGCALQGYRRNFLSSSPHVHRSGDDVCFEGRW